MIESRKFVEILAWGRKKAGEGGSISSIEFPPRLVEGYNRIKGSFSSNKQIMVVDIYQGLTDEPVILPVNLYPNNPFTRFECLFYDTNVYGNLFDIPVCGKYAQVKVILGEPIGIDDWFNIWVGVY